MAKQTVIPAQPRTNKLAEGYDRATVMGEGIAAQSHPEFEKQTPLDKVSAIASSVARGIKNLTGNNRSPSTVRDVGHGPAMAVRSDADEAADYKMELARRKKP